MTAPADMVGAAPIDELIPRGSREQEVSGGRTLQGRPDPGQGGRVFEAPHAAVLHREAKRPRLALNAPALAPLVLQLAARSEAELPPGRPDHRLTAVGTGEPK